VNIGAANAQSLIGGAQSRRRVGDASPVSAEMHAPTRRQGPRRPRCGGPRFRQEQGSRQTDILSTDAATALRSGLASVPMRSPESLPRVCLLGTSGRSASRDRCCPTEAAASGATPHRSPDAARVKRDTGAAPTTLTEPRHPGGVSRLTPALSRRPGRPSRAPVVSDVILRVPSQTTERRRVPLRLLSTTTPGRPRRRDRLAPDCRRGRLRPRTLALRALRASRPRSTTCSLQGRKQQCFGEFARRRPQCPVA
jgi:hypothetical protein